MSVKNIHLRKLLILIYTPQNRLISMLRDDIRTELAKQSGLSGGGGNFHDAFWSDAKIHAMGLGDLQALLITRVAASRQRSRLYPLLSNGFLLWWNEKRRWVNEPFTAVDQSVHARLSLGPPEGVIKIDNFLAVQFGDQSYRLVYPYFDERVPLGEEAARVGLWAIEQAIPKIERGSFRILDVIRGKSFSIADVPFHGDEEQVLTRNFKRIVGEWERLRSEY